MTVIEVTSMKVFNQLINSKEHNTVLIFYTAKDCICSASLKPIFEKYSKQYKKICFAKVFIDKLKEFEDHVELGTPNFHLYVNGKKVEQVIGEDEQGLTELCEKYN